MCQQKIEAFINKINSINNHDVCFWYHKANLIRGMATVAQMSGVSHGPLVKYVLAKILR